MYIYYLSDNTLYIGDCAQSKYMNTSALLYISTLFDHKSPLSNSLYYVYFSNLHVYRVVHNINRMMCNYILEHRWKIGT